MIIRTLAHLQSELSVYFSMDYDDEGNFSIGYNCDEFIDDSHGVV